MNLTNLSKGAWLELSASWRRKGGDRLELWLPRNWPAEDSELRWRRVAAGGAVRQGTQRGLEGLAPAEEIIVWTPATETLFLRARLPTRSAAKIVQALPFALEEQLIDRPERLHFAFAHEPDGALAVAVTRRERMESWLAALAAAGLAPTQLAPVTLSVPLAERAWTLAFVDGQLVLRSGARAGLGGPAELRPPAWLHAALAEARTEAGAPERILLVDAPADLDSAGWREALGLPLESIQPGDASVPAAPLDLLQQHYAPHARPGRDRVGAIVAGGERGRGGDARAPSEEFSGNPRDPRPGRADAARSGGPGRGQRHRRTRGHALSPGARRAGDRARIARAHAGHRVRRAGAGHPARRFGGRRRVHRARVARALAGRGSAARGRRSAAARTRGQPGQIVNFAWTEPADRKSVV